MSDLKVTISNLEYGPAHRRLDRLAITQIHAALVIDLKTKRIRKYNKGELENNVGTSEHSGAQTARKEEAHHELEEGEIATPEYEIHTSKLQQCNLGGAESCELPRYKMYHRHSHTSNLNRQRNSSEDDGEKEVDDRKENRENSAHRAHTPERGGSSSHTHNHPSPNRDGKERTPRESPLGESERRRDASTSPNRRYREPHRQDYRYRDRREGPRHNRGYRERRREYSSHDEVRGREYNSSHNHERRREGENGRHRAHRKDYKEEGFRSHYRDEGWRGPQYTQSGFHHHNQERSYNGRRFSDRRDDRSNHRQHRYRERHPSSPPHYAPLDARPPLVSFSNRREMEKGGEEDWPTLAPQPGDTWDVRQEQQEDEWGIPQAANSFGDGWDTPLSPPAEAVKCNTPAAEQQWMTSVPLPEDRWDSLKEARREDEDWGTPQAANSFGDGWDIPLSTPNSKERREEDNQKHRWPTLAPQPGDTWGSKQDKEDEDEWGTPQAANSFGEGWDAPLSPPADATPHHTAQQQPETPQRHLTMPVSASVPLATPPITTTPLRPSRPVGVSSGNQIPRRRDDSRDRKRQPPHTTSPFTPSPCRPQTLARTNRGQQPSPGNTHTPPSGPHKTPPSARPAPTTLRRQPAPRTTASHNLLAGAQKRRTATTTPTTPTKPAASAVRPEDIDIPAEGLYLFELKRTEKMSRRRMEAEEANCPTEQQQLQQPTGRQSLGTCGICLEEIEVLGTIECSHTFCATCILQWAQVTNLCPFCKQRFTAVTRHTPHGGKVIRNRITVRTRQQRTEMTREELAQFIDDGLADFIQDETVFNEEEDSDDEEEAFDMLDRAVRRRAWVEADRMVAEVVEREREEAREKMEEQREERRKFRLERKRISTNKRRRRTPRLSPSHPPCLEEKGEGLCIPSADPDYQPSLGRTDSRKRKGGNTNGMELGILRRSKRIKRKGSTADSEENEEEEEGEENEGLDERLHIVEVGEEEEEEEEEDEVEEEEEEEEDIDDDELFAEEIRELEQSLHSRRIRKTGGPPILVLEEEGEKEARDRVSLAELEKQKGEATTTIPALADVVTLDLTGDEEDDDDESSTEEAESEQDEGTTTTSTRQEDVNEIFDEVDPLLMD